MRGRGRSVGEPAIGRNEQCEVLSGVLVSSGPTSGIPTLEPFFDCQRPPTCIRQGSVRDDESSATGVMPYCAPTNVRGRVDVEYGPGRERGNKFCSRRVSVLSYAIPLSCGISLLPGRDLMSICPSLVATKRSNVWNICFQKLFYHQIGCLFPQCGVMRHSNEHHRISEHRICQTKSTSDGRTQLVLV